MRPPRTIVVDVLHLPRSWSAASCRRPPASQSCQRATFKWALCRGSRSGVVPWWRRCAVGDGRRKLRGELWMTLCGTSLRDVPLRLFCLALSFCRFLSALAGSAVTYFFCLDMLRRLLLLFVIGDPCTWRNCLPKEKRNFCVVIMVIIMSALCSVFDMSFTKF